MFKINQAKPTSRACLEFLLTYFKKIYIYLNFSRVEGGGRKQKPRARERDIKYCICRIINNNEYSNTFLSRNGLGHLKLHSTPIIKYVCGG